MLRELELMKADGVRVCTVRCDGENHGWSDEELVDVFAVVFVQSGVFRRRVDGVEQLADPMAGYCELPGSLHRIAHPRGGDICTLIELTETALGSVIDPDRCRRGSTLLVAPALDVGHRLLLRSIRAGSDQAELAERATLLAGGLLESAQERPPTAALKQKLVERVRETLREDPNVGLTALAVRNQVSIYHLSRVFREVTGTRLSHYRTQLRARLAMDRIADGEHNLARVAADVGFADQSHMTRALKRETQLTPGRLRNLLLH